MVKIMKGIKKPATTIEDRDTTTVTYEDAPPDGGWGWVVVVAAHFALLLSQGSLTGFGPFIIRLQEYFHRGAGQIAGISGTALFVTLATGPISSALNCRLGCRVVVIIGGLVATVGTALSSIATEVSHLYITYGVITGFGYGLVATPSIAFIARYFTRRYALANGIVFAGFAIGWIALPQLYQFFINKYGWRTAMMCLAAMDLHIIVCGALFRPPPQTRVILTSVAENTATSVDLDLEITVNITPNPLEPEDCNQNYPKTVHQIHISEEPVKKSRFLCTMCRHVQLCRTLKINICKFLHGLSKMLGFHLFSDPMFVLMAVAYFVIAIGFYPTILFLVARAESFCIPYPLPTTLMTITGAVSLIGRAGHGFVIDIGAVTPVRALSASLLICGLVNLISVLVQKYSGLAVLYGVFGLANGVYHPLLTVTLKDFVGVNRLPCALGFCNLCHGFGALIGPPIAGWILDNTHNYGYCYFFSGTILCLSAILLLIAPVLINKYRQCVKLQNEATHVQYNENSTEETILQFITTL
ncbi:monocarboxylate transporter 13-like [Glandiceps talaboti]